MLAAMILEIAGRRPVLASLRGGHGLGSPARVEAVLAEPIAPGLLHRGVEAQLEAGGLRWPLVVSRFSAPRGDRGGARIRLVDPVCRLRGYRLAVFAAAGGVSLGEVLRSRCAGLDGPAELDLPESSTIVVDAPFRSVVRDACARHPGWHSWRSAGVFRLGPPGGGAREVQVVEARDRAEGVEARVTAAEWPEVGESLKFDDVSGVVVQVRVSHRLGGEPSCRVVVGMPRATRRAHPRSTALLAGRVASVSPLKVDCEGLDGGARPGLIARLHARKGRDFAEAIPLRAGDPVRVLVACGGVSTAAPPCWLDGESAPSRVYATESRGRRDRVRGEVRMDVGRLIVATGGVITAFEREVVKIDKKGA